MLADNSLTSTINTAGEEELDGDKPSGVGKGQGMRVRCGQVKRRNEDMERQRPPP